MGAPPSDTESGRRTRTEPETHVGQRFLGFSSYAPYTLVSEGTETPRGATAWPVGAHALPFISRPRPQRVPPPASPPSARSPAFRTPVNAPEGHPEPLDPKARRPASRSGPRPQPPRLPSRETPPTLPFRNLNRASPEELNPAVTEWKPSGTEGLTFNRLDVAMFLQLRVSRDGARLRGARDQAAPEAAVPTGPTGPAARSGCGGSGRPADARTSSQVPGAFSLSPLHGHRSCPTRKSSCKRSGRPLRRTGRR